MKISYNKLWKLLIDLKIGKAELRHRTGIVSSTFTKLRNDEEVSMSIMRKNHLSFGKALCIIHSNTAFHKVGFAIH